MQIAHKEILQTLNSRNSSTDVSSLLSVLCFFLETMITKLDTSVLPNRALVPFVAAVPLFFHCFFSDHEWMKSKSKSI